MVKIPNQIGFYTFPESSDVDFKIVPQSHSQSWTWNSFAHLTIKNVLHIRRYFLIFSPVCPRATEIRSNLLSTSVHDAV